MPTPRAYRITDTTTICERLVALEAIAVAGAADPNVRRLAARAIERAAQGSRWVPWSMRLAAAVLEVTQACPYVPDPPGQEWFEPAGDAALYGGDCEDLSVLFVAICHVVGLPAQVIWITQKGAKLNHVTAAVFAGGTWLWADASVRGARLGESVYVALRRLNNQWQVIGASAPTGAAITARGRYAVTL